MPEEINKTDPEGLGLIVNKADQARRDYENLGNITVSSKYLSEPNSFTLFGSRDKKGLLSHLKVNGTKDDPILINELPSTVDYLQERYGNYKQTIEATIEVTGNNPIEKTLVKVPLGDYQTKTEVPVNGEPINSNYKVGLITIMILSAVAIGAYLIRSVARRYDSRNKNSKF